MGFTPEVNQKSYDVFMYSYKSELINFVAAPIKRHLSREKSAPLEGFYEFSFFFIFEQFRRYKLLYQHPYRCRIFVEFWCLSLSHHAPIRIKVVRGFNPAGEKEQGRRDPNSYGAPSLLIRAGTPVRETGPRKSSVPGRVQTKQ